FDRRLPVRGEPISNLYGPVNHKIEIGVRPGHHVIEAKVHGETLEPWEFDAKPGATLSHAFARKPASPEPLAGQPQSGSKALPLAVMGVGAGALAAGGVFGVVTLSKVNAISSSCPNNNCPATYALKPAQDDVHKFATITDALLVGGGVVTAAGLYLFFFTGGEAASPRPTTGAAKASLEPPALGCGAAGCMATMRGTF
ncbi:MAG: hypothetical protein JOZ69_13225, partial [Myxococcales bacterium]|nr:hypothetical protein [Myxococcales bacterium]